MNAEDKALIARVKERMGRFEASTGRAGLPPDPCDGLRRLLAIVDAQEAEVERLQRERAEWRDRADALMTEQMTQMRDLTAEVEALRTRLTLTPEKVERAVGAWWSTGWARTVAESDSQMNADIRRWLRAALLAAGMTEAK